jgi:hypothetical protein
MFNMKDQVVELLKRNDFIVGFSKRNASKVSSNICNFYWKSNRKISIECCKPLLSTSKTICLEGRHFGHKQDLNPFIY